MTPRFVPFESMSDAEQREHLDLMHSITSMSDQMPPLWVHETDHALDGHLGRPPYVGVTPHTHDKPAPRPECGCPVNGRGDIRCHNCGERVNRQCWNCKTPRGDGPCPNPKPAPRPEENR